MKKLGIILDETTIINFPHFWKLIRRYIGLVLVIPVLAAGVGLYHYLGQNKIYYMAKSFMYVAEDKKPSANDAVSMLMDGNKDSLSPQEIMGIVRASDFKEKLANEVYAHPKLNEMNFADIKSKKKVVRVSELFASCGEGDKCRTTILRNTIPRFILVKGDKLLKKKYWVEVKTLDPYTTKEILEIVVKLMVETRVKNAKMKVNEQISLTQQLINKRNEELEGQDIYKLREEVKTLQDKLTQISTKTTTYSREIETKTIQLAYAESKLKKTRETTSENIQLSDKDKLKKRNLLVNRIAKVTKDIDAIKLLSDSLNDEDRIILSQLRKKKIQMEKELKDLGLGTKSIEYKEEFLTQKGKEKEATEFNYDVATKQLEKLKEELKIYQGQRNAILDKLNEKSVSLEKYMPAIESIKVFNHKLTELRLYASTIVPDLIFDKDTPGMRVFKITSFVKVSLFTASLSLFLLFLGIMGRYLMDDRILDESELEKTFEGITIIGTTPDFD